MRQKRKCKHCERNAVARNLCTRHYQSWKRYGEALQAERNIQERKRYVKKPFKKCSLCGQIKENKHFHKNKLARTGFYSQCKECKTLLHKKTYRYNSELAKRKYQKRKEYYRKYAKEYNQRPGVKDRRRELSRRREFEYRLKTNFNITVDDYNKLLKKQDNKCKICKKEQNGRRLAVDHNHKTSKVRALLCDKCNRLLGYANENVFTLKQAIFYLNEYR